MPRVISDTKPEIKFRKRAVRAAILFSPEHVISEILEHADIGLDENREIMGLIIGTVYRDDNGYYAIADRAATSKLIADPVSVKFDEKGLEEMFEAIELSEGESVIGWYHSHLDIGCFMSETDIRTQDGIFGGEFGIAIVIDPVRKEMKVFDSTPKHPMEIDMVITE